MISKGQYLILVHDVAWSRPDYHGPYNYRWQDSGEGPFDHFESAREFAENEVGLPWIIVQAISTPESKAHYDARLAHSAAQYIPGGINNPQFKPAAPKRQKS